MSRLHRYTVQGFEFLASAPPSLIVGYHGRPAAFDLCMLSAKMFDELGSFPHAVAHSAFFEIPLVRNCVPGLGFVRGTENDIAATVAAGGHLIVTPGGAREGYRSSRERYAVDWGSRRGYLKLAIRHGLQIVPVGASGVDDTYLALNNGYKLGKRLKVPLGLPAWLALGPTGVWPFSPPFPVKIEQVIGRPINPFAEGPVAVDDHEAIERLHIRVKAAVQTSIDEARGRTKGEEKWVQRTASTAS